MRIFLADPHPPALLALKAMVHEKPNFEFVGEASEGKELLVQVKNISPDLVLIDWELPGKSIEEMIAEMHACEPRPIIVVMGTQPEYGRRILQAGADAFVSKADQPEWLIETLEKFAKQTRKKKNA